MSFTITKKLTIHWPADAIFSAEGPWADAREAHWQECIAANKTDGHKEIDEESKSIVRYWVNEEYAQEWIAFVERSIPEFGLPQFLSTEIEDVVPYDF